jgi:hypothetical protein
MGSLAAGVILCSPGPAGADNAIGRWSDPPLGQWPLIPIHLVLLPDGKVLSYGTNQDGTQTGHLIYDVWDPRQGSISGGHLTLPNTTPDRLVLQRADRLATKRQCCAARRGQLASR